MELLLAQHIFIKQPLFPTEGHPTISISFDIDISQPNKRGFIIK